MSITGISQSYDDYPENQKREIFKEEFTKDLKNFNAEGKEGDFSHRKSIMYGHDVILTTRIARSFSSLKNLEYELYIKQTPEIDFTLSWYTASKYEEHPSRFDFICRKEDIYHYGSSSPEKHTLFF